jgi:hypothetical protein
LKLRYIFIIFLQKNSMNKVTKTSLSLGLAIAACLTFSQSAQAAEITGTRRATINWFGVQNAESYNIYYKEVGEAGYSSAVRDLSKDSRSITINYLKNKGSYVYNLCAVDGNKVEFWCTGARKLVGSVSAKQLAPSTIAVKTVKPVAAVGGSDIAVTQRAVTSYHQATVTWMKNQDAQHYYIYYKKVSDATWTHSVFGMNADATNYTINYLDPVKYEYKVVALDGAYKPIAESVVYALKTVSMRL